MDQYGDLQDFSIDYLMRILGDAPIMPQLHGDVLELGTLEEQLPWSGGATAAFPPTAATAAFPPPTPEFAPLPPSLANPPPGSTATEYSETPVGSNFCRVLPTVYVADLSHEVSGGSKAAEIAAPTAFLHEKVAGETSEAPKKTTNISAGATKSTDKPALPPVDGDRKRKGKQIIEVDDDSEVPPTKPKRTRNREMHNLVERRRRHNSNDKMNNLFKLIPECIEGSRTRGDRLDKAVFSVTALIHKCQYLEAEISYHQMMCPYSYMPPAMATPPPPPVLAAAAGLNLGPAFPAPAVYPPAAAAPIFPPPQAAVMVPLEEYQRVQMQQMALMRGCNW